jgi:uncharacterized protein
MGKIHDATKNGDIEVIEQLLETGVDVNTEDEDGQTPLRCAADAGHTDVTKMLIEHGADVNARGRRGYIALHRAVEKGHTETARLLLEHGADVNAVTQSMGFTPLHRAVAGRHVGTARLLLEHGANVDAENNAGMTPLVCALIEGDASMVKVLQDYVAKPPHIEGGKIRIVPPGMQR